MKNSKERRKCVRFEAPFCIDCKNPDNQQILSGAIKDISMSGACVLVDSDTDLPADKTVPLSLIFPETTLNVKAKIIWQKRIARKNKVGLVFSNLPDSFKNGIYDSIFKYHRDKITSKWWDF
ncbi:MAG: PilZ domain-containing protein [Candidatus Omnitrophica bacterium]|nr:PilZ domain-containing protein [Candidatus Omnitrophota bacterium]MCF7894071.1 PilZ domain-containing protein [Candidatus Omnitrophota bacterium]